MKLNYQTLEKLALARPVDRIDFVSDACRGKRVLDIGCYDETALVKRNTRHWLHGRISELAHSVVGVDASEKIPLEGIETGLNSRIFRGDGVHLSASILDKGPYDMIVAGEFIEHLESPLEFLREMRRSFPGQELILTTPNGVTFANTLLGGAGREVQHPDHLHNFTFKVLNTLCLRSAMTAWEIRPYRFYATEMILNSTGTVKMAASGAQSLIRGVEWIFPLLSFGYIVRIRL